MCQEKSLGKCSQYMKGTPPSYFTSLFKGPVSQLIHQQFLIGDRKTSGIKSLSADIKLLGTAQILNVYSKVQNGLKYKQDTELYFVTGQFHFYSGIVLFLMINVSHVTLRLSSGTSIEQYMLLLLDSVQLVFFLDLSLELSMLSSGFKCHVSL